MKLVAKYCDFTYAELAFYEDDSHCTHLYYDAMIYVLGQGDYLGVVEEYSDRPTKQMTYVFRASSKEEVVEKMHGDVASLVHLQRVGIA